MDGQAEVGWRIVKAAYAERAFDGEGARLYGGRWNAAGTPLVYLAESRSLALLEVLVHLHQASMLASYVRFRVEIPAASCTALEPARLPAHWRDSPAPPELQELGEEWVAGRRSVALAVPSAIVPEERLFLLNPVHPDFARVRIGAPEPIRLDPRLEGAGG
ncbi:MAG: RES domain-containing protein [Planctomycetota bacterium]